MLKQSNQANTHNKRHHAKTKVTITQLTPAEIRIRFCAELERGKFLRKLGYAFLDIIVNIFRGSGQSSTVIVTKTNAHMQVNLFIKSKVSSIEFIFDNFWIIHSVHNNIHGKAGGEIKTVYFIYLA
jgi:hypothetical protein